METRLFYFSRHLTTLLPRNFRRLNVIVGLVPRVLWRLWKNCFRRRLRVKISYRVTDCILYIVFRRSVHVDVVTFR